MKVAVSIPDEEYVGRHAAPSVTQALDRVLEEVGVYEADEFTRRASRRALGRSDW